MRDVNKTVTQSNEERNRLEQQIAELRETEAEYRRKVKAMLESEKRYRSFMKNANDAIYIISHQGFEYVNPAFEKLTGYGKDELCSETFNFWNVIAPEDHELVKKRAEARKRREKIPSRYEFRIITKDGQLRVVEAMTVEIGKKGKSQVMGILRDETEKKQIEDRLKESEKKYRDLVDNALVGVYQTNLKGDILFANEALVEIMEYDSPADFISHGILKKYKNPKDREVFLKNLKRKGRIRDFELEVVTKSGKTKNILISASINEDVLSGMIRDITRRKKAEARIKASLKEKEVLLQEIHHRVKNNMQVISSLISLQSRHLKDKLAIEIFRETKDRVRSMALIHESLYRSKDLGNIDFEKYICGLTTNLFHSYYVDPDVVRMEINVENIFLDINTAIPCGLLINELISNSLKHAFPMRDNGEISLNLRSLNSGKFLLSLRDNGVGFPEDIDFRNTETLGMQLVNMLVQQIDGKIKLSRNGGTQFDVSFKEIRRRN